MASVACKRNDRRGVLALLAGGLAASTAAVASNAVPRDGSTLRADYDKLRKQHIALLTLFGKMEEDGRIGWGTGLSRAKGLGHLLWIEMTDDELIQMIALVAAGMVLDGSRTVESFRAILENREVL